MILIEARPVIEILRYMYTCMYDIKDDDMQLNNFSAMLGCVRHSKTCVKRPLSKRPKIGFQDQLSLNAGQKYCRMLQGEHSAILLTFTKQPFVITIFVLPIFEWPFDTRFTVLVFGD